MSNADADDGRRVRCTQKYPPTPAGDWDHGFIADEQEYLEQRLKLQPEREQLTPVPDDELQRAADMLENFGEYWENLEGDKNGRHGLVKLIVECVYMDEDAVVKMKPYCCMR